MRISDWSSEVCSSDLVGGMGSILGAFLAAVLISELNTFGILVWPQGTLVLMFILMAVILVVRPTGLLGHPEAAGHKAEAGLTQVVLPAGPHYKLFVAARSEEHTSELQSLMRISSAVFCLKKKKQHNKSPHSKTKT